MLRWLTAGESHGPALVGIIEGVPAGVELTSAQIADSLARRRLGYGRGARMKFEQDAVRILGGVRHGSTLGGPSNAKSQLSGMLGSGAGLARQHAGMNAEFLQRAAIFGVDVVVEGRLGRDGTFRATTLLAKDTGLAIAMLRQSPQHLGGGPEPSRAGHQRHHERPEVGLLAEAQWIVGRGRALRALQPQEQQQLAEQRDREAATHRALVRARTRSRRR